MLLFFHILRFIYSIDYLAISSYWSKIVVLRILTYFKSYLFVQATWICVCMIPFSVFIFPSLIIIFQDSCFVPTEWGQIHSIGKLYIHYWKSFKLLFLQEDDKYEFSEPTRIQGLVKNYSQFVSFPIYTWLEKSRTVEVMTPFSFVTITFSILQVWDKIRKIRCVFTLCCFVYGGTMIIFHSNWMLDGHIEDCYSSNITLNLIVIILIK